MNARPEATSFLPVTKSIRLRLEATIEHLVALLDEIDGDPDLEDGGDVEDGGDAEPEETDHNGDEDDFCRSEDDATDMDLYGFLQGTFEGGQGL